MLKNFLNFVAHTRICMCKTNLTDGQPMKNTPHCYRVITGPIRGPAHQRLFYNSLVSRWSQKLNANKEITPFSG